MPVTAPWETKPHRGSIALSIWGLTYAGMESSDLARNVELTGIKVLQ